MKIKDGFSLQTLGERTVVVPVGARAAEFHCMMALNETGAFLWQHLQQATDTAALCTALAAEYAVSAETAAADVQRFVALLREQGLLEE